MMSLGRITAVLVSGAVALVLGGGPGCGVEEDDDDDSIVEIDPAAREAAQTLADMLCTLEVETCDCGSTRTLEQCVEQERSYYETQFSIAQNFRYGFEPSCMDAYVAFYTEKVGCNLGSDLDHETRLAIEVPPCKLHHGWGERGDSCAIAIDLLGDDCLPELRCWQGNCVLPRGLEGETCGSERACEEGTYCGSTPDGVTICQRLPGEGQPCAFGECEAGTYCATSDDPAEPSLCVGPLADGEPCEGEEIGCSIASHCEQVCTPLPVAGEFCTEFRECEAEAWCDHWNNDVPTCVAREPVVCPND